MLDELQLIAADEKNSVICYNSHYFNKSWTVSIERESDGVKLKVEENNDDLIVAAFNAVTKWKKITETAIPEFTGPLLEHQAPPPPAIDDEIPF